MDESSVLELLEDLSILLEDAKPVFGKNNLRQVDVGEALDIIDEIRDRFPGEFNQARAIVRERQNLLDDAEAEANRMISDAQREVMTIASDTEVVRIAHQQAEKLVADAREFDYQTRAGAQAYAEDVFNHVEQSLDSVLNNVRRSRERLNTPTTQVR